MDSPSSELPEKYEILGKFFDALDTSIRLLKMKGSKPIFSNIFGKVEIFTDRKFSYYHLAQLKHILPEAIEVKRVLKHHKTTCCTKPDLHVTINADAVEYNDESESESKKIALSKVFWARLAAFVEAYPQGDEVPEEPLPEPFNRRKPTKVEVKSVSSLMEVMVSIPASDLFSSSKLFSSPITVTSTPVKTATLSELNTEPTPSPVKLTSPEINIVPTPTKAVSTLAANVPLTPAIIDSTSVIVASTPPEFASTPAQLMGTARPQKRSSGYTNPDDVSSDPPAKLVRRSLSLNFDSYPEDEKTMDFTDDETIDQIPEEDVVSSDDEILSIQSIKEQERKAIEGQNPAISLAKRRRKMIACLLKLFDVVHCITQALRRWVMTKEELVHKIIAVHLDITDRSKLVRRSLLPNFES